MRSGVRLGIDVGTSRVGIARSDPDGILAVPVQTSDREAAAQKILELCEQWSALEVVVGLPLSLRGTHTASTEDAVSFARSLKTLVTCPVRLIDERLSSVSAASALRGSGRGTREHKPVVDQVAAVILLQHALDSERAQGTPPGDLME